MSASLPLLGLRVSLLLFYSRFFGFAAALMRWHARQILIPSPTPACEIVLQPAPALGFFFSSNSEYQKDLVRFSYAIAKHSGFVAALMRQHARQILITSPAKIHHDQLLPL